MVTDTVNATGRREERDSTLVHRTDGPERADRNVDRKTEGWTNPNGQMHGQTNGVL